MDPVAERYSDQRYKAVFLIPYFGKIPDYFDLWALSAASNPDFAFYIFSDLPFDVSAYSNIRVIPMTFAQLKARIQGLMDFKITLHSPYKLCDFKPAYGHIFSEYIQEYDFWGFCDIDLIFGRINHFITDRVLSQYDKILYQGHFTLMRNNMKMNLLYRQTICNVQNYRFAFRTKLDCHFDENGTIAYADEYDHTIRFGFKWIFFDTNVYTYEFSVRGTEACFIWKDGILTGYWDNGNCSEEYMYVHLQKRHMIRKDPEIAQGYVITRNEFLKLGTDSVEDILSRPIDSSTRDAFVDRQIRHRKKILRRKILSGWVIFKATAIVKKWRNEKNLRETNL